MRPTRTFSAFMAALVSVSVLAGCSGGDSEPAPAPTAGAGAFAAATTALASTPYRYVVTLAPAAKVTGAVDPKAGNLTQTAILTFQGESTRTELLFVGTDHYVKASYAPKPELSNKWLHFDPAKVSLSDMLVHTGKDPTALTAVGGAVVSATRTGSRITGTVDLTKAGDALPGIDAIAAKDLGTLAAAKAAPFEAAVDDKGRLTSLTYVIPAYGETEPQSVNVEYSAIGEPVTVRKPDPAEVVEATDEIYKLINAE